MTFFQSLPPQLRSAAENNPTEVSSIMPDISRSYFLTGVAGSGKTSIAIKFGLKWDTETQYKQEVIFHKFKTLLDMARYSFDSSDQAYSYRRTLEDIKTSPLLIIDDIGTEKYTEFVDQMIYDLINYRYEWGLQTIFTSNFTLDEISKKYHERVASRILGMCGPQQVLELPEMDYRGLSDGIQSTYTVEEEKTPETASRRPKATRAQCIEWILQGIEVSNPEMATALRSGVPRKNSNDLQWIEVINRQLAKYQSNV